MGPVAPRSAWTRPIRRDVAGVSESGDSERCSVSLFADLNAFSTDYRQCGDLDAGVYGLTVWLACGCGASMARSVDEDDDAGHT
jgi:hypothetical protein